MSVTVCRAEPSDFQDWGHVIRSVYGRASETEDFPLEEGETRFVARLANRPVGACSVQPYLVARGARDLRMGGVAAVATLPEVRGQGVAKALMTFILSEMREGGQDVSALYPYRETYYRQFGYETCGWRYQIKCPQGRIPLVESHLTVRQLGMDELESLNPTYETFIRSRSGSPLRTKKSWEHRMGKRKPYVYAIGNPVEAYLWATHEEFWTDVQIGEVAWSTKAGYEGCLGLMKSLCSNMSSVTWCEPPDSRLMALHRDQGMEITVNRPSMYRIIDLKSAIAKIRSQTSCQFTFEVRDDLCPWNSGIWRVNSSDDSTDIVIGLNPDFKIGIGELSQGLMGQPSLAELARLERVEIIDRCGFDRACQFFAPHSVVCMEFF